MSEKRSMMQLWYQQRDLMIAARTDQDLRREASESPRRAVEVAMYCLQEAIELLDCAHVIKGTHETRGPVQEAHGRLEHAIEELFKRKEGSHD